MDQYRLPKERFLAIYREAIEAPELIKTRQTGKPRAIFLGGQPGCGKSTIAKTCDQYFGTEGFVHVDVDRLRDLHPAYLPLVSNRITEAMAPTAVQKDCSSWSDMLVASAMTNQRNVLIDGTMRVPEQVRVSVNALRAAGYVVEARIMAVHEKASEVSLLQRFEHEKQRIGFGRTIPFDYHAKAAAGIVETVQMIEQEKLFDHVVIFNRSGNTIYENRLENGDWLAPPLGAERMNAFRDFSYDLSAKREIAQLWDDVIHMMNLRGAGNEELRVVKALQNEAREIAELVNVDRQKINAEMRPPMPIDVINEEIRRIGKGWPSMPGVTVVGSTSELPFEAPSNADGAYYDGHVFVIAENIVDSQQLQKVMAHECVLHHGLQEMLGDYGFSKLHSGIQALKQAGDPVVGALAKNILERYGVLPPETETKEIIARAGEQCLDGSGNVKIGFGFMKSVYAGVAGWLRDQGFKIPFTNVELQGIMHDAGKWIQRDVEREWRLNNIGSEALNSMSAWHGSSHDHDKFSTAHIGSGEGRQAYGHGLYFAGSKAVGEYYANMLSGSFKTGNDELDTQLRANGGKLDEAIATLADRADHSPLSRRSLWTDAISTAEQIKKNGGLDFKGRLYQVNLIPSEDAFLLWDKPLSEQSSAVQDALMANRTLLEDCFADSPDFYNNGREAAVLYSDMEDSLSAPDASQFLRSIGIRGIQYLDGNSRSMNELVWKENSFSEKYDAMVKGVAENYLKDRGDVKDAIVRLKHDAAASRAPQYADAAMALENGDLILDLKYNYVVFDDADIEIVAKYASGVDVVSEGSFSGKVLDVIYGVMIQKTGRNGETVRHDVSQLDGKLEIGEIVDIRYCNGVGTIITKGKCVER